MADNERQSRPMSKEQKIGFVFLLIFGILAVSLGTLQLRNTIYGPFVFRLGKDARALNQNVDENTRLQQIDTDHDGINDYQELYFYETSPYLEDTDSDGVLDKAEIDKGTDPLCPEGTVCAEAAPPPKQEPVVSPLAPSVQTPTEILLGAQAQTGVEVDANDLSKLLQDPAHLREALLSTGKVTKEQLEKVSDEQLLKLVSDLLAAQQGSAQGSEEATIRQ